jgi:hypothetical protein
MSSRSQLVAQLVVAVAPLGTLVGAAARAHAGDDISALDQHFNRPGADIAPGTYVPATSIKEFSTEQ